ncbi:unnamed protein product [Porites evermanni]|uniref:SAP30-binding protein n=1 Tax=Porites evermanni TaxID=104178 RepID=A0ABN8SCL0_9CNID|nr:unnamed protein product [Porites evermanni]
MDNPRIGSLNSLADYGLGESDIEDSDDEVQDEDSRVKVIPARPASNPAAQARVKTSARLVSYDDEVADEDEGEGEKETKVILCKKQNSKKSSIFLSSTILNRSQSALHVTDDSCMKDVLQLAAVIVADAENTAPEEKSSETAEDSDVAVKSKPIPAITMPQLPPEPTGRCSNKLQEKIIDLLEKKHKKNLDLNTNIQNRKDFRNPSIYKKLLSYLNLDETGSNYPKSLFDPTCWTEESYYENLSKVQKEAYEKKEKEKAKQARTHVEFLSGTKKPNQGEEPKKRKSKWDVSVVPAPVKTATPPTRVGGLGPSVVAAVDLTSAAKKPKIVS